MFRSFVRSFLASLVAVQGPKPPPTDGPTDGRRQASWHSLASCLLCSLLFSPLLSPPPADLQLYCSCVFFSFFEEELIFLCVEDGWISVCLHFPTRLETVVTLIQCCRSWNRGGQRGSKLSSSQLGLQQGRRWFILPKSVSNLQY